MIAAILAAEGRDAGPQPGRLEHDLGRGDGAARAARQRGPLRGRRGLAAEGRRRARPLADRARQPLPRPARPLRRDRDPRRRVGDAGRRARRAHPLRPQRRRPADRRPRPRRRGAPPRGRRLLRHRRPLAGAARAPARLRRQALPPLRPPLRLRARLRRPPRPLLVPELRRDPARARRRRDRGRAARDDGLDGSPCATPAGELRLELPLPGLYNVYNALAATRRGARARRRARAGRRRAGRRARRLRPGRDDRGRRQAGLDPADQEPGRAPTRCCARCGSRPAATSSTSGSPSTTGSPTAATSPGSGTPTSSCSRDSVRRVTCAGTRAAGDGAAAEVRGLAARSGSRSSREIEPPSTRAVAAAPDRLFALPTYTALLELRKLLSSRGLAKEFWR